MGVLQEFYCWECKTYMLVSLKMHYDRTVEVVCAECGHKHQRKIEKGELKEAGRYNNTPVEEIIVPKSACSKEPYTDRMKKAKGTYNTIRDGIPVDSKENARFHYFSERWLEKAGHERYGYDGEE